MKVLICVLLLASTATAATMAYPDLVGNTVTFLAPTEDNTIGELFFLPPAVIGDTLVWLPSGKVDDSKGSTTVSTTIDVFLGQLEAVTISDPPSFSKIESSSTSIGVSATTDTVPNNGTPLTIGAVTVPEPGLFTLLLFPLLLFLRFVL